MDLFYGGLFINAADLACPGLDYPVLPQELQLLF